MKKAKKIYWPDVWMEIAKKFSESRKISGICDVLNKMGVYVADYDFANLNPDNIPYIYWWGYTYEPEDIVYGNSDYPQFNEIRCLISCFFAAMSHDEFNELLASRGLPTVPNSRRC